MSSIEKLLNEELERLNPKSRMNKLGGGILKGILVIGMLILGGLLAIVAVIVQLALAFILTVYVITFGYGLFIDTTLFATQSIFTIPFNDVVTVGFMNPWLFWVVFITMILRIIFRKHNENKKMCAMKK